MSKTFCPIPWVFQAARNNGDIRVCCQANVSENKGLIRDNTGKPYNVRDGRLDEARNAPLMKEMRVELLDGRWPKECVRCKDEEKAGLNSRRSYENNNWNVTANEMRAVTSADGTIDTKKTPTLYYDLRFGNKCNLACRMCGPTDSDSWYNDYVELTNHNYYYDSHGKVELEKKGKKWIDPKASYQWYESDVFWTELEERQDSIQHIYMAGGEPLLIDQHYDFLESCIEKGISKNIIIEYNTNLTLLPQRVIKIWKLFKEVRVGASIDGFGKHFEFQRYPGKWDAVYKNLQKLDELEKPIYTWLAYTVTVYNVLHLPEFIHWKMTESGFKRLNSSKRRPIITHHMAHNPKHLNVRVFSKEQKEAISKHFSKYKKTYSKEYTPEHAKKAIQILESVETYMNSGSYHDTHWEEFTKFTKKMDHIRGEESSTFLP